MRRLRVAAAGLAFLTAVIDWLLAGDPAIRASIVVGIAFAALCLAAFTPFEVLEPPGRKLVLLACAVFLVTMASMLLAALQTSPGRASIVALAALTMGGGILTIWSFTIRNRRRRPAWSNYYDK